MGWLTKPLVSLKQSNSCTLLTNGDGTTPAHAPKKLGEISKVYRYILDGRGVVLNSAIVVGSHNMVWITCGCVKRSRQVYLVWMILELDRSHDLTMLASVYDFSYLVRGQVTFERNTLNWCTYTCNNGAWKCLIMLEW